MDNKEYSWLNSKYLEFEEKDILNVFMNKNYLLIKLYSVTKSKKLALFIGRNFYFQHKINLDLNNENKENYDRILESLYEKMIKVIKNNNICKVLDNVEKKNVSGFNFYNAYAFPRFNENMLAVNTGIFFLSHTLVRSIEFFLKEESTGIKLPFIIRKYLLKEFIKTSEAIICENHLKSFSSIRLIASDDSLLFGIEMFFIAHEYAHLLFKQMNYNYTEIKFEKYFHIDIIKLIHCNEEIAADAFAIIILKYYQLTLKEHSIAIYSPQFIFKILSNYDELMFANYSNTHPTNLERYNYIKNMINIKKYDKY